MNKIAELQEKIRIERMKLNLDNSEDQRKKILNKIKSLQLKIQIEQIKIQIEKLG